MEIEKLKLKLRYQYSPRDSAVNTVTAIDLTTCFKALRQRALRNQL